MKHIYEGELTLSWCGLDENCQFGDPDRSLERAGEIALRIEAEQ